VQVPHAALLHPKPALHAQCTTPLVSTEQRPFVVSHVLSCAASQTVSNVGPE
jgi:hypothetical protein